MRRAAVLFVLIAASCASAPVRQCIQLAGTFHATGACTRSAKSAKLLINDDLSFKDIVTLVIEQTGCALHLRITGDGGAPREADLATDIQWNDIGFDYSWEPKKSGPNILPGASREQRTISMKLSDDLNVLTLTSAYDEHGLALLFVPFHNHNEATCVFKRAVAGAAPAAAK